MERRLPVMAVKPRSGSGMVHQSKATVSRSPGAHCGPPLQLPKRTVNILGNLHSWFWLLRHWLDVRIRWCRTLAAGGQGVVYRRRGQRDHLVWEVLILPGARAGEQGDMASGREELQHPRALAIVGGLRDTSNTHT